MFADEASYAESRQGRSAKLDTGRGLGVHVELHPFDQGRLERRPFMLHGTDVHVNHCVM